MPVVYSKVTDPALADQVLWVDDYVSLERHGLLSLKNLNFGFRTYIPSNSELLRLNPDEYLKAFRQNFHETTPVTTLKTFSEKFRDSIHRPTRSFLSNAERNRFSSFASALNTSNRTNTRRSLFHILSRDAAMPTLQVNGVDATTSPTEGNESNTNPIRPGLTTRKSSTMHQNIMKKLRPMPFQYVWAVWHDKASELTAASTTTSNSNATASETYSNRLTLLADQVPDIGAFYRIYNHFPWDRVKVKDSVHVFRAGVRPLWEDPENLAGGGLTVKVKREEGKAVRAWEEVCVLACGGELQAAVLPEHDHVLGVTYSPRLYQSHITIWNKQGNNAKSVELLKNALLERLSPELKPTEKDVYYKKHSEKEGWKEAIRPAKA